MNIKILYDRRQQRLVAGWGASRPVGADCAHLGCEPITGAPVTTHLHERAGRCVSSCIEVLCCRAEHDRR